MGLGIDWSSQLADELHKPVRRRFEKRTGFAKQVNDICHRFPERTRVTKFSLL